MSLNESTAFHLVGAHLRGAARIIALPDHLAGDLGDREDGRVTMFCIHEDMRSATSHRGDQDKAAIRGNRRPG